MGKKLCTPFPGLPIRHSRGTSFVKAIVSNPLAFGDHALVLVTLSSGSTEHPQYGIAACLPNSVMLVLPAEDDARLAILESFSEPKITVVDATRIDVKVEDEKHGTGTVSIELDPDRPGTPGSGEVEWASSYLTLQTRGQFNLMDELDIMKSDDP